MAKNKFDEKTEDRILNAAIKIMCRDGIQGARMQDIADLANINRAMLHYYFRDKKSLVDKAIENTAFRFHDSIHKRIDDENLSFDEKIEGYIDVILNIYSENTEMIVFAMHESLRDKTILTKIFKDAFTVDSLFFNQLENEIKKGRIKPFKQPYDFVVLVVSICAFPFAASSIFNMIFRWGDNDKMDKYLADYKKQIPELVKRSIYVE